jgi:hypothetical protein
MTKSNINDVAYIVTVFIACPSSTFAEKECMPVTTTAYKIINQSLECTPSITSTKAIPQPFPSSQYGPFSTKEVVTATSTKIVAKTITSVTMVPCSSTVPTDNTQQQNESIINQSQSSQALGALLGLVVVVLAIVITGWVWTCWVMKKRGGMKIISNEQERWDSELILR